MKGQADPVTEIKVYAAKILVTGIHMDTPCQWSGLNFLVWQISFAVRFAFVVCIFASEVRTRTTPIT